MSQWLTPPAPPLTNGSVHVWRMRPESFPVDEAIWLLTPDERERAARFHFEEHRRFYISGHALVRRVLGWYAGAAAAEIGFVEGEYGKPSLLRPDGSSSNIEFNVSHSGELVLLAVGTRQVGVDVEQWKDADDLLELSEQFFSPRERELLNALAHDEQLVMAGFFSAWSRKEAYLKASGAGITHGLDHFAMQLTPGEAAAILHDERDPAAHEKWHVTNLDVGEGYSAALVAERPVNQVILLDYHGER